MHLVCQHRQSSDGQVCNIQAISAPTGFPLWVADVEPGSIHDLTVAREHILGDLY